MNLDLKNIFRFLLYVLITIVTVYYLPSYTSTLWIILLLILYWYSNDEPFWLAFFLVVSDGFFSFFGHYDLLLSVFPGMPAIEIGQLFVILSVLKARYKQPAYPVFYSRITGILGIYILLLILIGFFIGVKGDLNIYFRIFKLTVPFLLFYSIPKLMRSRDDYMRFFALLFPVAFMAFIAQLFEIITLEPIASFLGAKKVDVDELMDNEASRAFYNPFVILLSLFGSLFYLSQKGNKFNNIYLYAIALSVFFISFFSATRGWIIGTGTILILYLFFVKGIKIRSFLVLLGVGIVLYVVVVRVPVINKQVVNAYERFLTVEDVSNDASSTNPSQIRTTVRGPRVMKAWRESPIIGLGFSNQYRLYSDVHVGNQNILMHSGIIGFSLMMIFFLFFLLKLYQKAIRSSDNSYKVFAVFFIGWFFIHSTSGQHFAYALTFRPGFTQALFFSFGAYCFAESERE